MTNTFTRVNKTRFYREMQDMGFDERHIEGVKETVFARNIPGTDLAVVIFSTFENGVMRSVGSGAIKVKLWNNVTGRPIASEKRINRVGDELKIINRLRRKVRECWEGADESQQEALYTAINEAEMKTKPTAKDISEVAMKMYSSEELKKMSKQQRLTLLTLIRNNLVGGTVFDSKELAALKDRFMTKHSHPAVERLRAALRSSPTRSVH